MFHLGLLVTPGCRALMTLYWLFSLGSHCCSSRPRTPQETKRLPLAAMHIDNRSSIVETFLVALIFGFAKYKAVALHSSMIATTVSRLISVNKMMWY